MPAALELSGQTFGQLVVRHRSRKDTSGAWMWLCQCACSRWVEVRGATLNAGRTSACASCATRVSSTKHGATGTPLYGRWRAMLNRCELRSHSDWSNYGGRGITVCARWHEYEAFAADMGPTFESHLELDRIDVDGNYEPSNCRWATRVQQQNNKRSNHVVTWLESSRSLTEWSEMLGIKPNTLLYRIRRGWPVERAMTHGVDPSVLLAVANEIGRP